ncbi:hypothetical protein Mapa_007097 [Marchantia paleacea]|nr:hypothetical protein Mapa_007097 [Marchantia paleacea]
MQPRADSSDPPRSRCLSSQMLPAEYQLPSGGRNRRPQSAVCFPSCRRRSDLCLEWTPKNSGPLRNPPHVATIVAIGNFLCCGFSPSCSGGFCTAGPGAEGAGSSQDSALCLPQDGGSSFLLR